MKCPTCKATLIRWPLKQEDGSFREVWIHPDTANECSTSADGTALNVEDLNTLNAFQEFIKNSGLKEEEKPSEKEEEDNCEKEDIIKKEVSNISLIQKRLSEGNISVSEYDEILKRVQ